jgi:hypothetical protein
VSETVVMEDVVNGARLLSFGMRPKLIPSRDLIYAELVKRFAEDGRFRELTEAIAEGLGLTVLAVLSRTGVVLGPGEGSAFEQKFDDYARRAVLGERRDLERVLHGIAHLAIAALAFPRPDDLAVDTYVGRVSVEQADSVVREACTMLAAKAAAAEEAGDPRGGRTTTRRRWCALTRSCGSAGPRLAASPPRPSRESLTPAHPWRKSLRTSASAWRRCGRRTAIRGPERRRCPGGSKWPSIARASVSVSAPRILADLTLHIWHVRAVMYGVGEAEYAEPPLAQKRMGSLTATTAARIPAQITGHRSSVLEYRHRHVARKSGQ